MRAALRAAEVVAADCCGARCAELARPSNTKNTAKRLRKIGIKRAKCNRFKSSDRSAPAENVFDILIFRSYSPLKRIISLADEVVRG